MSEKHWSESLNDGLNAINEGLGYINPAAWVGKIASANTNYVDTALGEDGYNDQGTIRRSPLDFVTGITPSALKRIQDKQIDKYLEKGDTQLGARARDYNLETKVDGKFTDLRSLSRQVEKGDRRSAMLPEGLLQSDLNLPEGKNIINSSKDVFERSLRAAKIKLENNSKLTNAGIDPSSVRGTAAINEAIRKKTTSDEIEKQSELDDAYENSKKGKREASTHSKGLDLINQQISSSKAATDLASVVARNQQTNQLNENDWREYVYGDGKREAEIERNYQADREDARFDANLATIRLQNSADMERYEMMLKNDKEVRRSESISDLLASLSMLGGAFMI